MEGLSVWGVPDSDNLTNDDESEKKVSQIAHTLTRVLKKEGTVWLSGDPRKGEYLKEHLDTNTWECEVIKDQEHFNFIAKKIN